MTFTAAVGHNANVQTQAMNVLCVKVLQLLVVKTITNTASTASKSPKDTLSLTISYRALQRETPSVKTVV
jgi:hypothetical protein